MLVLELCVVFLDVLLGGNHGTTVLIGKSVRGGVVLQVDVVEGIGEGSERGFTVGGFELAFPYGYAMPSHLGKR